MGCAIIPMIVPTSHVRREPAHDGHRTPLRGPEAVLALSRVCRALWSGIELGESGRLVVRLPLCRDIELRSRT